MRMPGYFRLQRNTIKLTKLTDLDAKQKLPPRMVPVKVIERSNYNGSTYNTQSRSKLDKETSQGSRGAETVQIVVRKPAQLLSQGRANSATISRNMAARYARRSLGSAIPVNRKSRLMMGRPSQKPPAKYNFLAEDQDKGISASSSFTNIRGVQGRNSHYVTQSLKGQLARKLDSAKLQQTSTAQKTSAILFTNIDFSNQVPSDKLSRGQLKYNRYLESRMRSPFPSTSANFQKRPQTCNHKFRNASQENLDYAPDQFSEFESSLRHMSKDQLSDMYIQALHLQKHQIMLDHSGEGLAEAQLSQQLSKLKNIMKSRKKRGTQDKANIRQPPSASEERAEASQERTPVAERSPIED